MLKYRLTALALKAFSSSAPARKVYRALGNSFGGGGRTVSQMPFYYYERVERNLRLCELHSKLAADDVVLELGTGWVHWEAVTLRLFFDFKAVLYDVWDNRQLLALKSMVRQLTARFGNDGFLAGYDLEKARRTAANIEKASSFDELYSLLGFRYVLEPAGLMEVLPRNEYRLVVSAGVMEHIPAATAQIFIDNMAALLKHGGVGIHSINTTDHLYLYDRSASPKQYLSYSEDTWQRWFENGVQYINRIQRSEWLRMFDRSGLALIEEGGAYDSLAGLKIHPRFKDLDRKDVECTTLDVVVRKP
jgi:hypothetical protein